MGNTIRRYLQRPIRRPLARLYDDKLFGDDYVEVWRNEATPLVDVVKLPDIYSHALYFTCSNGKSYAVQLNRTVDYC